MQFKWKFKCKCHCDTVPSKSSQLQHIFHGIYTHGLCLEIIFRFRRVSPICFAKPVRVWTSPIEMDRCHLQMINVKRSIRFVQQGPPQFFQNVRICQNISYIPEKPCQVTMPDRMPKKSVSVYTGKNVKIDIRKSVRPCAYKSARWYAIKATVCQTDTGSGGH